VSPLAYVHQLVAIAEGADPEKIFAGEQRVYHRNGIKFDNRPENVEAAAQGPHERKRTPSFYTKPSGYESVDSWIPSKGVTKSVRVHQLVVIAEGGDPEKVFSGGEYHIHHRDGVPFDNRAENLELLSCDGHSKRHGPPRQTASD
jgi:hypothetical protein